MKFKVDSKIPRCIITNINPKNSKIDINIPNLLIKNYGNKNMGIYLTPRETGIIKINDSVHFNY